MLSHQLRLVIIVFSLVVSSLSLGAQDWIQFEMAERSALPIVRASVNGLGDHRFILDAGFNEVQLDILLVDGSGMRLRNRGESKEIDFFGEKETVPVAYLDSLGLGGQQFSSIRTLLIDGDAGLGMDGIRSYGRIGRDVLERLRLTVHYPRKLLLLEPSPEQEVPKGGVLFTSAGRFLLVPVRLSGAIGYMEGDFVVDPNSSTSLLDRKWAMENQLASKQVREVQLDNFEVGGFLRKGFSLMLGNLGTFPYVEHPVGVLGADFLRSISISYDFPRELLWLMRVEKEAS